MTDDDAELFKPMIRSTWWTDSAETRKKEGRNYYWDSYKQYLMEKDIPFSQVILFLIINSLICRGLFLFPLIASNKVVFPEPFSPIIALIPFTNGISLSFIFISFTGSPTS